MLHRYCYPVNITVYPVNITVYPVNITVYAVINSLVCYAIVERDQYLNNSYRITDKWCQETNTMLAYFDNCANSIQV